MNLKKQLKRLFGYSLLFGAQLAGADLAEKNGDNQSN